jgi:hypothetical protein
MENEHKALYNNVLYIRVLPEIPIRRSCESRLEYEQTVNKVVRKAYGLFDGGGADPNE